MTVSQKLGEKMYADMQAKQAAEGGSTGGADGEQPQAAGSGINKPRRR
jgi:molecular chaperone DnaK